MTQNTEKLISILKDVWNQNIELVQGLAQMQGFDNIKNLAVNVWVSYVMCYGFNSNEIIEFAKQENLKYDPNDCDPDDPNDHYGAISITSNFINKYKEIK